MRQENGKKQKDLEKIHDINQRRVSHIVALQLITSSRFISFFLTSPSIIFLFLTITKSNDEK